MDVRRCNSCGHPLTNLVSSSPTCYRCLAWRRWHPGEPAPKPGAVPKSLPKAPIPSDLFTRLMVIHPWRLA